MAIKCTNCGREFNSYDEAKRDTEVLAWLDDIPYCEERLYCPACGADEIYEEEEEYA